MAITGGQAIICALEAEGVELVFGYPGGAILPVFDSLRESSKIHYVLVRQEQAAAHAASGYARATGRVGVCMATSGPGATNLITGIATAYMDSIPLVAITGQVAVDLIGRDAFQEVDITGATEPFSKHNYLVKNVNDIPRVIKEAFHIASTGRPGPVLIDIPKDVALSSINFKYPDTVDLKGYKPNYEGHPLQIKKVVKAIKESKKPLICVGGGAILSDAAQEILELAEKVNVPVAMTLMGIGGFPGSHPLNLGLLGIYGTQAANTAVNEADLLLLLGARMGDRATGNLDKFAKKAIIAHIDIDPAEIGKNVEVDIPIVGDLKGIVKEINKLNADKKESNWAEELMAKDRLPAQYVEGKGLDPKEIIQELSKMSNNDMIVATDVGQHQMWTSQYYKVEKPGTFITSGGLGTMGYGLPAAIGAKMSDTEREVLLITGDGSFQMNLTELATAAQENLKMKIILFNNSSLGMVRELQQQSFESRYFSVHMTGNPDFSKIAEAYGLKSIRVTDKKDIKNALKEILESKDGILGEFFINLDVNVVPYREGI
ncbi:acetolactate synthase large subunit [Oxobacter pfennigii]|uniref:Acetolactate synthase n=1 Tax=Oxobacter pfennigii TaxID=36849 RepID=A0A0P8Z294_9CLOT|nr:biosynthetic-type acetolactate synthase large subunit [Oxobacter pfennigii]KPU46273.1 acetolactate synthase large subunit [Oxobacter pfennigii]